MWLWVLPRSLTGRTTAQSHQGMSTGEQRPIDEDMRGLGWERATLEGRPRQEDETATRPRPLWVGAGGRACREEQVDVTEAGRLFPQWGGTYGVPRGRFPVLVRRPATACMAHLREREARPVSNLG